MCGWDTDVVRNYRARAVKDGKPVMPESYEHEIVAAWLNVHKIVYCHVPNGEWRHPATARRLKRLGVKPGVPDFLIFDPPPLMRVTCGTVLEIKALDGKLADLQAQWLCLFQDRGWIASVKYGANEAIKWLESLGYGK